MFDWVHSNPHLIVAYSKKRIAPQQEIVQTQRFVKRKANALSMIFGS